MPPETHWEVPTILLAIVVMASPLLVGTVHATAAAALAAVAIIALWWHHVRSSVASPTDAIALSIPTVLFSLLTLLCVFQLLPLPPALVGLLQPTGHAAAQTSWELLVGQPLDAWRPLSMDPRATATAGLKWGCLAATCALASQITTRRRGRRRWLGLLLIAGLLSAVAGLLQSLSGTNLIMGLYEAQLRPRSLSAFVSTNHAAAFYGLIAIIAIAYALDHRRRSPLKTTLGACAAALGVFLCAYHRSDGALVALGVATFFLILYILIQIVPHDGNPRRQRITVGATLATIFALILSFILPERLQITDAAATSETSAEVRLLMARAALRGALDFPIVGSGAGSIERTLGPYLDWVALGGVTIPTIEAEPIEWVMTLGPLAALLILAAFAYTLWITLPHLFRSSGRRGPAFAACFTIYLGLLAMVHFPFTALGLALPALVAIEACLDPRRDAFYLRLSPRLFRVGLTLATILLIALFAARATLLSTNPADGVDAFDDQRTIAQLYPSDARLLSSLSLRALRDGDADAAHDLAQHAFQLHPHPQQQLLLASTLAATGDHDGAADLYADLFDDRRRHASRFFNRAQPRLHLHLPTADLRAQALADAAPSVQRRYADHLADERTPMEAIDFAQALLARDRDQADAHLILIDLYRDTDQILLADLSARALVNRDLTDADGQRPAGLMPLIDLAIEQERPSEALLFASRAFAAGQGSPELGRHVLDRLLPSTITDELSEMESLTFGLAIHHGCVPPYERSHQRLCWRAHAHLALHEGRADDALSYLRRIERLHDDPRPLAQVLAARHDCRDLARLLRRHEDTRHERTLERLLDRCVERRD